MPKPIATNCAICQHKAGPVCNYWTMLSPNSKLPVPIAIDKLGSSELTKGYICPDPKK